jgi:hypothetical protein
MPRRSPGIGRSGQNRWGDSWPGELAAASGNSDGRLRGESHGDRHPDCTVSVAGRGWRSGGQHDRARRYPSRLGARRDLRAFGMASSPPPCATRPPGPPRTCTSRSLFRGGLRVVGSARERESHVVWSHGYPAPPPLAHRPAAGRLHARGHRQVPHRGHLKVEEPDFGNAQEWLLHGTWGWLPQHFLTTKQQARRRPICGGPRLLRLLLRRRGRSEQQRGRHAPRRRRSRSDRSPRCAEIPRSAIGSHSTSPPEHCWKAEVRRTIRARICLLLGSEHAAAAELRVVPYGGLR